MKDYKDWKERLRDIVENEKYGLEFSKPGSDLWDELAIFIEQIISERDKEIIQVVKNMGRLGNTQQEKDWNAMLSWVLGELENNKHEK